MKVLLGKLARPQFGEGGSIILGELTRKELKHVIHFLSVALSHRDLRDHYGHQREPVDALQDGLRAIQEAGFEEQVLDGRRGHD